MSNDNHKWYKYEYGGAGTGHWTIDNGHISFDVHIQTACGSDEFKKQVNVSVEQADLYAERIMNALNATGVENLREES